MCRTAHRGRSPGGPGGGIRPTRGSALGAGRRPLRSPTSRFRGREKKEPHGPFGFLVLMTRRRGPATFDSAPRARRCARSTAPTRTTPPTPPPGSHPRHAGPAAPLHPGTSRDSSTHMGCRPYPPSPPLSCLDGCAAVPAGDERTAKPVRERPASRRAAPAFFQRSMTGEAIALKTLRIGSGSGLAGMKCIPSNNRPCVPLTALAAFHSRADTFA